MAEGDLTYPEFPRRVFVLGGLVVLALIAAAVVVNLRGPSVAGCTVAAKRQVAATGRVSAARLKACDGLSTDQVTAALEAAYRSEYGKYLGRTPMTDGLPPASYRTASAHAAVAATALSGP